jgi:hypothetical protein
MLRKKSGSIEWLEFEQLTEIPSVIHGVFLKHGGESKGPFASLNFGGGTGDDPEKIRQNRMKVLSLFRCQEFISGKQCHGVIIRTTPIGSDDECDGLLTTKDSQALTIKHADCQAAIFYDPVHQAVGNVHCGWRGNVGNIYSHAIDYFKKEIGSKPEDLLVSISPSLGPCCSEFINYKAELPESFLDFQVKPTYFNLWELSRFQLIQKGVLPHHIEMAGICTCCNREDFFSYRRDKTTGRNATVVALR